MASSIITGTDAAASKIARVEKYLRSQRGLETAGEHVLNRTALAFRRGINPMTGSPWKPLKPNTIISRRKRTSKPLNDSGLLRASFNRGGRDNIFRYRGSDALIVGSSSMKAVWHHFGTDGPYTIRPTRKAWLRFPVASRTGTKRRGGGWWAFAKEVTHPGLVARPMIGVNRAQAIRIAKTMKKHVDRELEG